MTNSLTVLGRSLKPWLNTEQDMVLALAYRDLLHSTLHERSHPIHVLRGRHRFVGLRFTELQMADLAKHALAPSSSRYNGVVVFDVEPSTTEGTERE